MLKILYKLLNNLKCLPNFIFYKQFLIMISKLLKKILYYLFLIILLLQKIIIYLKLQPSNY